MRVSTYQRATLEEVYLFRAKAGEPLSLWIVIGGTTLHMTLDEAPGLITALDEALEKAELAPADAMETVWKAKIAAPPVVPDLPSGGTP